MVSLFSFIVMLLYIYYVSQDFGQNVCYSQGKKKLNVAPGGGGGGRGGGGVHCRCLHCGRVY